MWTRGGVIGVIMPPNTCLLWPDGFPDDDNIDDKGGNPEKEN